MKTVLSKVTLFLIAAVLVISSLGINTASAAGNPFKDVSSSDEEILYLFNKGIVNGITNTTFVPKQAVTREEAAVMIGRAKNLNKTPRKTSFPDVAANRYSSGYIQSAYEKGYITGNSDGTFRPKDTMTRGEMAFLLSRAFGFTKIGHVYFTDLKTNNDKNSL